MMDLLVCVCVCVWHVSGITCGTVSVSSVSLNEVTTRTVERKCTAH